MIPSSKFHEKRVKKYYIIELIPHGDFCVAKREVNILVVWSIFFAKFFQSVAKFEIFFIQVVL